MSQSASRTMLVAGALWIAMLVVAAGRRANVQATAVKQTGTAIHVNDAKPAELCLLRGIGPKLAARIVDDRRENGPYRKVDELRRVSGIGARTIDRVGPYISVEVHRN